MRKSKIKQISLAVCLALMPYSSFAAGLGKLNVSSGLGEPLKAEIELLSVTADELATLVAAIANEEAYASQGIPRLGIHNAIKVELSKDASGSPVLKLYSNQPVSDPYLDMLIQVDWASGRLQREYTVLLDPPGYKQMTDDASVAPIAQPVQDNITRSAPQSASQKIPNAVDKTASKNRKTSAPSSSAEKSEKNTEQQIITKRGDTLNAIAKNNQIEGVSLDQMLVGLYESNKDAFSKENMNRLKVGKVIKVPTKDSFVAPETKQAKETVKLHADNWNAYRNALAGAVALAPVAEQKENKQAVSGKIATAQDKAVPLNTGPKDVVKLSAGDSAQSSASKNTAKMADAKALAAQEAAIVREKELADAKSRGDALEKQIQDMQKLLALKSQTMQTLQKNAETAEKALASAKDIKPPEEKPSPVKPAEVTQEQAKSDPVQEQPSGVLAPVATPAETAEKPVVKPKKIVQLSPPVAPKPEPSFLDKWMDVIDLPMVGGVGALGLFGALWVYLRNKRRKDLDSFERGILTAGGLRANTVFGNTTGSATNADTSFLTDFAQSTNGSMIDANDVDPIAEAEVYMAYGRDAQAEEILKDAISKQPRRYELHLKLLEIYAGQKDASAFVAIAGELYTTLGADDPTWAKVAAMGVELEPDNPLYKLNSTIGANTSQESKLSALDFDSAPVLNEESLDFSFDNSPAKSLTESMAEPTSSANPSQTIVADIPEVSASDMMEVSALDFNFDAPETKEVVNNSSAMENSLDFDLSVLTDNQADVSPTSDQTNIAPELLETKNMKADSAVSQPDSRSDFDLALNTDANADLDSEQVIDFDLDNFALAPEGNDAVPNALSDGDKESIAQLTTDADNMLTSDLDNFNFGLPADTQAVAAVSAIDEKPDAVFDFPLEIPTLGSPSHEEASVDAATPNASLSAADDVMQKTSDAVASAISDISFDLDALNEASEAAENRSNRESIASDSGVEFNLPDNPLNNDESKTDAKVADDTPEAGLEANEFDLSGISLDLDDALDATTIDLSKASDELTATSSQESPDVEIKLDLVAAYIDMDDKEGARELLEEVMQEGGPQQQLRAQQLLNSLV